MKMLSLYHFNDDNVKKISEIFDYKVVSARDIKKEDVKDAEVIIGNLSLNMLKYTTKMKWLQLYSAGSDMYKENMLPDGCILTNASGTFGLTINEHLLMTTLMLMRNMQGYFEKQKNHIWEPIHRNKVIHDSVFIILGCGDLGQRYAKSIQFLGGYTIGIKRRYVDSLAGFDEVYTMDKLDELLKRADVICLALPNNEGTKNIMNEKRFSLLKKDCFLLNVGRGNSIDETALLDALEQEKLAGAHLDVFQQEPLDKNSKLWGVKNLIITPHVSGTFANKPTRDLFENLVVENVLRYAKGEQLKNIVDFESGYRIKTNED